MNQALKEKEDSSREAKKLLSDYTKELNVSPLSSIYHTIPIYPINSINKL